MSQRWTNTENEFVKQNSSKLTDEQMARAYKMKFQRPMNVEQIRKHRQRLGIKTRHGRGVCEINTRKVV